MIWRTVLFLLLLTISVQALEPFLPYYWGNLFYGMKLARFERAETPYDTVFFGSSRTHRHIDPQAFDRAMGGRTRSFNLGVPATFNPETYYLYRNFLDHLPPETDTLFLELQVIAEIPEKNLHTLRSKYYLRPEDLPFIYAHALQTPGLGWPEMWAFISRYTTSVVENLFNIGVLDDQYLIIRQPADARPENPKFTGPHGDGFYALDDELQTDPELSARRERFLQNQTMQTVRFQGAVRAYRAAELGYSPAHLGLLNELLADAETRGVTLIFYITPRMPESDYLELLPLVQQLDPAHWIDLGSPFNHPEFYALENAFDEGHLNAEGAGIMTRKLAEAFAAAGPPDPGE